MIFYFREYFNPPSCPYIKVLEKLYEYLGCNWISKSVKETSSPNKPMRENTISETVKNNISKKAPLIITDKQGRFRKNINKHEQIEEYLKNINVKYCESINRTLYFLNKESTDSYVSACIENDVLYISPYNNEIDYYDIGYCICKKIMKNNHIHYEEYYDITMILIRSIDILKIKGYLVDKLYDTIEIINVDIQDDINETIITNGLKDTNCLNINKLNETKSINTNNTKPHNLPLNINSPNENTIVKK